MGDLATTVVQGNNNLLVKVFDESVKDEVLKALQRSDFELSVQTEGKDIRVKLGTSRKEHVAAGLKKAKTAGESFKRDVQGARKETLQTVKKLGKILPQDEVKLLEDEFELMMRKAEEGAKKMVEAKERELN